MSGVVRDTALGRSIHRAASSRAVSDLLLMQFENAFFDHNSRQIEASSLLETGLRKNWDGSVHSTPVIASILGTLVAHHGIR